MQHSFDQAPWMTLTAHLARSSNLFSKQGEYLCTAGLQHLLSQAAGGDAFAAFLSERTKLDLPDDLRWFTEAYQTEDKGRPDVEGRTADGVPFIKIEAKLGARLEPSQLRSYAEDLRRRGDSGNSVLVVLVPEARVPEAEAAVVEAFDVEGVAPTWRFPDGRRCIIVSWAEALDLLEAVPAPALNADTRQLRGLYLTLGGFAPAPSAADSDFDPADPDSWQKDAVDKATRKLWDREPVYPFGNESGYVRRYVGREIDGKWVFYSLGVRVPFAGHDTPFWLRYHCGDTPFFPHISDRLLREEQGALQSEGHIWVPIPVDVEASAGTTVEQLVAGAERIHSLIWRS